ncbi:hypothetical protein CPB83DRAFT_890428 [Crepidotus variabilis]|uniref:Uncharacterized protein n=1 Tax=Crepidotus variabilis TaxID=179855 RepID=A0A9P6JT60_9AGAR|nr:hypothetical protein CPB83DRAFT_890428 [Crepidotus variabilis]
MPFTQFPIYHPTTTSAYQPAVFSRSLMSLGHGFAPWQPGAKARPEAHFHRGMGIGDVGFIGQDGALQYRFNIFFPSDHPIQPFTLPRTFNPIEPPLEEWTIRKEPEQFPAGTILTSKGVKASKLSQEPLEVEFKSDAREGAVLILPEGASREDLVESPKLYEYIKANASDWYQFMNDYSDFPTARPVVNGTLFVVTGTDKANFYSSALFPTDEDERMRPTTFKYVEKNVKNRTWQIAAPVRASSEQSMTKGEHPTSVFLRGVTVALSKSLWTHDIAPIPVAVLPLYYIPSIPLLGKRSEIMAHFVKGPHEDEDEDYTPGEAIFHPAILLLQILLEINPDASVAVVDDNIWCPLMDGRTVVHAEIAKLITSIIETFDINPIDGVARFIKKSTESTELTIKEKFQAYIQFFFTGSTRSKTEQQALRKLKKLLSKPDPIPTTPS